MVLGTALEGEKLFEKPFEQAKLAHKMAIKMQLLGWSQDQHGQKADSEAGSQ